MADRLKVLLVDGDRARAASLTATLRERQWDVIAASDAIQALTLALKERPDALVVASQLAGGGGASLLKRLRSVVHTSVTPAIGLVAADGSDRAAMLEAGAQECHPQGSDAAVLCEALRRHTGQLPTTVSPPRETIDNPQRMQTLAETGLLDKPSDEVLDQLIALASKLLRVPTATITLVDRDRQFFTSQVGLPPPLAEARQTPLSHSFCQWVVSARDEVVVDDARTHAALRHNAATRDYNVVAYAGVPLSSEGHQPLGSFCAIDSKARHWSATDLEILRNLRRVAELHIASIRSGASPRNGG